MSSDDPLTGTTAPLTPEYVERCVRAIEAASGDYEVAHGMEDELHQGVLLAIAEGRCANPAEVARVALTTQALDFSRWCA